jgi:hypothetical protein
MNPSLSSDSRISMVLVTRSKQAPPQFPVAPEPYSVPRCFASTGYPTHKTRRGVFVACTRLIVRPPTDFGTRFWFSTYEYIAFVRSHCSLLQYQNLTCPADWR